MKLIIQIPCLNEESTLPLVVAAIPREIAGLSSVEILVIDDGSADRTVTVARECGVDHIISHVGNKGLAQAFRTGIDACLRLGADIIITIDGDDQYPGSAIPRLIAPILRGEADLVVADRQTGLISHFSPTKKALQALGSWTVRKASQTDVPDAPSGFRAYSRDAAMRLNVVSDYSYTMETLIQAGARKTAITHVPIEVNPQTRQSRLFDNYFQYIKHQMATIVRTYAMYQPLKIFTILGTIVFGVGAILIARFLFFYVLGYPGLVQSLVLGAALVVVGLQIYLNGLLADLIASNRRLLEEALYKLRRMESPTAPVQSVTSNPENVIRRTLND